MTASAADVEEPALNRALITVSIMLGTVMQVLDTTIANVALPDMQADLGASRDTINWVLTSYIVAAAIATPLTGWMSDRFGRKQIFITSIVGFVLLSMACGMAWNLDVMVLFRLMQGLFGAAIVPLSQTFLLDINPPEKHGSAMAMWGAGIMVGPIVGPTLGGWLTETLNWRWVFFINLPVGLMALAGCLIYLPRTPIRIRRFDFFGFAMLALGIGALQMLLDRGNEVDWFSSAEIWLELFLTITGFWIFTVHILTSDSPFVDPRIFTDRNFSTGLIFIFIIGIILLSTLALLPPMLSNIFDYPTLTTGLVMAPRGIGTMIAMIIVGRLVHRTDARLLVLAGLLLAAISLYMMAGFSPQMGEAPIVVSGVIQGLGLGFVFVPLSTVAFSTIAPALRADCTALFSLVRNIGSSIGISAVTVMLTRNVQINHTELSAFISPYNPNLVGLLSHVPLADSRASLAIADGLVNKQALMISYIDDFKLLMFTTLAAVPLIAILRRSGRSRGASVPAAME